jgi:hypothetical protein
MIIKRSLQFLAPLLLVAALGACGSDSKTSSTSATTVAAATTTTASSTAGPTTTSAGGSGATVDTSTVDTTGDSTATGDTTGDSTGGAGAGTPFCQFENDLNSAFGDAEPESVAALIAVFKQFDTRMDAWVTQAPAAMKANAQTLVDAARKTVSTGDPSAFATEEVDAAGTAIDSFCGD